MAGRNRGCFVCTKLSASIQVLIGLRRFDTAIDMWGLGMMLLSVSC